MKHTRYTLCILSLASVLAVPELAPPVAASDGPLICVQVDIDSPRLWGTTAF